MTIDVRARTAGLVVAFVLASAALPAVAAQREQASDDAQQVDKTRATIAGYAETFVQKQGGSRILFKVDTTALREAMVTDLRDEVYRILREGRIPFAGLTMREGGVEVRSRSPRTGSAS